MVWSDVLLTLTDVFCVADGSVALVAVVTDDVVVVDAGGVGKSGLYADPNRYVDMYGVNVLKYAAATNKSRGTTIHKTPKANHNVVTTYMVISRLELAPALKMLVARDGLLDSLIIYAPTNPVNERKYTDRL